MSRILRRPMFRKGGVASNQGIVSGLDRPGYEDGGRPIRAEDFAKRFKAIKDVYQQYAPTTTPTMGPGTLPGFLTSFGLDLLSRPAAGNIFQTAAQSAQRPFQQFQAARGAEEAEARALNRAILGDVIEAETEEEQARLRGEGTKGFEFLAKQETLKSLNQQQRDINKKLKDPNLSDEEKDKLKQDLEDNKELQALITKETDPIEQAILAGIQSGSLELSDYLKYKKTGELPTDDETESVPIGGGAAEGGRIGYQIGGEVETPMMNRTSAPVVAMDYTTLRSRLPKQIGDDIVKLIAESEEALTDFANIRTQEDVDKFNDTYRVNLVLPQEV